MESAAAAGERKRKVYLGESELSASSIHLKAPRLDDVASASSGDLSYETVGGDDAFASCCTSNGSGDLTKETSKFVDLEVHIHVYAYIKAEWNLISMILFSRYSKIADTGINMLISL